MKAETSIKDASEEKLVKSSFSVTFIIQKGKIRVDGTAPILARVIVNKMMTHIATKQYIRPDRWLPEEHRTRGCTKEEKEINEYLSTIQNGHPEEVSRQDAQRREPLRTCTQELSSLFPH